MSMSSLENTSNLKLTGWKTFFVLEGKEAKRNWSMGQSAKNN